MKLVRYSLSIVFVFIATLTATGETGYPRIGAMHSNDWGTWWQPGEVERLARYDLIDISPQIPQSRMDSIRMFSAGKTILGHHGPSIYYHAWMWNANHPMYFDHVLFDTVMARGLWLYSVDSTHTQHCYTSTWEGDRVLNLTTWAPPGPEGLPAPYWLGRYFGQAFRDRKFDGWVFDYGSDYCSWFEPSSGLDHNQDGFIADGDSCFNGWKMDANNDFIPDDHYLLDQAWRTGMGLFLDGLRDGSSPTFRILVGSSQYAKMDGMWYEKFLTMRHGQCASHPDSCPPYWEYRWHCTMLGPCTCGYLTIMDQLPSLHEDRMNLMAPSWYSPTSTRFTPDTTNPELMRHLRLSLGSTLLGDGFCALVGTGVPGVPDYQTSWWFDQYEYDLGNPLNQSYCLTGLDPNCSVWRRDFQRGHILVNASCASIPASPRDYNRPATPSWDASIWGPGAVISPRLIIHYPDSTVSSWTPCSRQYIRFHARPFDYPTSVDLFLSTDGGASIAETLAVNITEKFAYRVQIPGVFSTHCRIIGKLTYNGSSVWDTSDVDFTITEPVMQTPDALTIIKSDSSHIRLDWRTLSVRGTYVVYRSLSYADTVGQAVDTVNQTFALFPIDTSKTVFWWVKSLWTGCQ